MVHFVFALAFGILMGFVDGNLQTSGEFSGYLDVKSNSHMFYTFVNSTHPDGHENRPWIIWLQGGPWEASCGHGYYETIGPTKIDGGARNTTWVKQASVLFIDAPVGTGFSYVDDASAYNNDISEVVDDLMVFLRKFLNTTSFLQTRPLYIFGQSNGGKIGAHLAKRLYGEIQRQSIQVQFVGLAMGNAWISPIDSTEEYPYFLNYMSLLDEKDTSRMDHGEVKTIRDAIDAGNWTLATTTFLTLVRDVIPNKTHGVDIFDLTKFMTGEFRLEETPLYIYMNGDFKTRLANVIPQHLTWLEKRNESLRHLAAEFMKPAVNVVSELLENTTLQVIVYQGQLDVLCNTQGALSWVEKLTWSKKSYHWWSDRRALINPVDSQPECYVKAYDRFKFYSVIGAGHSVPQDKGDAAYRMLDRILNNSDP